MGIRKAFLLSCVGLGTSAVLASITAYALMSGAGVSLAHRIIVISLILALNALAGLGLTYWVVQPIRRRLYDIEEAAALIGSGRLHQRVVTMGLTDEIGHLAEQFNRMGQQIEQQVGMLQRLADENRRLALEAERSATLDERQRLARELHDSISQQLFGLTMLAASAERQFQSGAPQLGRTLTQLSQLANGAQREMRALLLQLRPVELEGRSLGDATSSFLQAVEERHGLACTFTNKLEANVGPSVEEHLFRILQEAVANVLKHAEARLLQVVLASDSAQVVLEVTDDGLGIPEDNISKVADSYGIRAMRERAAALGGRCELFRRDHGTAVEVRIPLLQADNQGGMGR